VEYFDHFASCIMPKSALPWCFRIPVLTKRRLLGLIVDYYMRDDEKIVHLPVQLRHCRYGIGDRARMREVTLRYRKI